MFTCIGASNHTKDERAEDDYYRTEPEGLERLLAVTSFNKNIWECACGDGALSEVLKANGYNVKSSDLFNRGYGEIGIDFLTQTEIFDGDILTNPPYKYAEEFVRKGLELIPEGNNLIMLLRLAFLESTCRYDLFKEYPPKFVYVASKRITCYKNGDMKNKLAGAMAFAWYVWEKGYKGEPTIRWI